MDNNDYDFQQQKSEYSYILNGEPAYEDRLPQKKHRKKMSSKRFISVICTVVAVLGILFRIASNIPDTEDSSVPDITNISDLPFSGTDDTVEIDESRGTVHYSEMEYVRPDTDAFFAKIDKVIELCRNCSYEELEPYLDDIYTDYWHFDTMYWLADTRSNIDVTDEFYYNECLFMAETSPLVDEKIDEMLYALAGCPISVLIDKQYYGGGYLSNYTGEYVYNEELVNLFQRESELIIEYQTLISSATVEINGETVLVDEYLTENYYDDDKYYECLELYYEKYGVLAGEIYIQLVDVRQKIAYECGYDSYIDYAYDAYSRDYSPDDVREYVRTVTLGVVPLYIDLYNSGDLYEFTTPGNMTSEENQNAIRSAAQEMGGRVYEIFCYMEHYGLFDIDISGVKSNLSFQTYFEDWNAPFLLIDATGTYDDYLGFAHEFGHFVDTYINYNTYITTDASESCSQAMEYLTIIYSSAFGEDRSTVTRMKMVDTVALYAEQGAYNAFEEAIYAIPASELTTDRVRQIAHDIYMEYGIIFEDDHEMYDNMWIDIPHFFTNPFYIVSYIVSNDAAFQIYQQELHEPGSGVETFILMADRDWDLNYIENLTAIGLDASFSIQRAESVVNTLYEYFE